MSYKYDNETVNVPEEVAGVLQDFEDELIDSSYQSTRKAVLALVQYANEQNGGFTTEDNPREHARLIDSFLNEQKEQGYSKETMSSRWTWVSRLYQELSIGLLNDRAFLSENPIELLEEEEKNTREDYLPDERKSTKQKRQYYIDKKTLEKCVRIVCLPLFVMRHC